MLALLVRDAVAAAAGVATLKAQGLVVYPSALTAVLDESTWSGVSNVLAAGASASTVSAAAAALSQVLTTPDEKLSARMRVALPVLVECLEVLPDLRDLTANCCEGLVCGWLLSGANCVWCKRRARSVHLRHAKHATSRSSKLWQVHRAATVQPASAAAQGCQSASVQEPSVQMDEVPSACPQRLKTLLRQRSREHRTALYPRSFCCRLSHHSSTLPAERGRCGRRSACFPKPRPSSSWGLLFRPWGLRLLWPPWQPRQPQSQR